MRPSGTEPIMRIYAESKKQDQAELFARTYVQWILDIIAEKR